MEYGDVRLPERFWVKVHPEPMSGCWLWGAGVGSPGYGVYYPPYPARGVTVHRLVLSLKLDRPLGQDMECMHSCDVKRCMNPAHLSEATHWQNMVHAGRHGLMDRPHPTACPKGHAYTVENTLRKTRGAHQGRGCRECNRIYLANRRARLRESSSGR